MISTSSWPLSAINKGMKSKWDDEETAVQPQPKKKKHVVRVVPVQPIEEAIDDKKEAIDDKKETTLVEETAALIAIIREKKNISLPLRKCNSVDKYQRLNRIEEGSYGIVYRGKHYESGEIVALKRLKWDKEREGFPITSLREINALMHFKHKNITELKEVVVGSDVTSIFIVMEYVEHDLKSLMEEMKHPFMISEIKTIILQLFEGLAFLHEKLVVHRDIKTSNILISNRGQVKLADLGLARKYHTPKCEMTPLVVTLWYRAPELLLGVKSYGSEIDIWSVGCILGELIQKSPLFPGKGEIDQIDKIFRLMGLPNEKVWPGFNSLPNAKMISRKYSSDSQLRKKFNQLSESGLDLLINLLQYDPTKRLCAKMALSHSFFKESPLPKHPDMFPSWPARSSGEKMSISTPTAPHVHESTEAEKLTMLLNCEENRYILENRNEE